MTFAIWTSSVIAAIAFVAFFVIVFQKSKSKQKLGIISISLLLLGFSMFILSLTLNYAEELLNEGYQSDAYQKIGPYGDLVGGLVNPVIAFIGIVAASLAFYAQYRANTLIQEQFNIQQFESQFYEMLRLHRENLNEMKIEGYIYDYHGPAKTLGNVIKKSRKDKEITGKKIFVSMIKELEAIHLICYKIFIKYHTLNRLNTFEAKQLIFDHSYYVFFNGISLYKSNVNRYVKEDVTGLLSNKLLDDYIKELESKRASHQEGIKEFYGYLQTGSSNMPNFRSRTLWLSFNYKPFSGHQSQLAHYYRHLIQTVKFVVKQDIRSVSYKEKRDYLRILRAVLSNHEQILLYYNWLSGFGTSWEHKLEDIHQRPYNKPNNKFFTDYRMIHNVPDELVIDDFKPTKIFDAKYQSFLYEEGRKKEDTLFEIMGIESRLK